MTAGRRRYRRVVAAAAAALCLGGSADATAADGRLALLEATTRLRPRRLLVATAAGEALAEIPGLSLQSCRYGICTARLEGPWPNARLEELAAAVEVSSTLAPQLEESLPRAGVPTEWPSLGLDGEGVIVAIVDSGIDIRHPDFLDDQGRTRILYLIDLSLPPAGVHPELESRLDAAIWTAADVDAQLEADLSGTDPPFPVLERDTHGHGTHVASVAAGRRGVAPAARIIAVRASRRDWPVTFDDADVLDASRLVFDLAAEEGLPCVLLLALGGHAGPHDGTSLLELGLADLVGGAEEDAPGRAVVVAAGNGGHCGEHAGGTLSPSERAELVVSVGGEDPSLAVDVELWYDAESRLDVALRSPDGEELEWVSAGETGWTTTRAARIGVASSPDGPSPLNGDLQVVVSLRRRLEAPIGPGRYALLLSGEGRFDAYLTAASEARAPPTVAFEGWLEPDGTLTVPATSPSVISVGATVSRAGWVDEEGRPFRDDRYRRGELAAYSGSGPSRTGAPRPDVVAPGHAVVAALSDDARPPSEASVFTPVSPLLPDGYRVAPGGESAALWGTSVAAPHVAGVVAVLFQRAPDLSQGEARSLLAASARTANGARGRAWSPRWGFGEVDGEAALALLEGARGRGLDGEASAIGTTLDVVPPGGCTTVTVVPRDAGGIALGSGLDVRIHPSEGPSTDAVDRGGGRYFGRWCADEESAGTAVEIGASVDGEPLGRGVTVFVAGDRRRLGGWAEALGGCGAVARPSGRRPGLGGLLFPSLAARRARPSGRE